MTEPRDPNPMRLLGLGAEFAGATLVMALIGYAVDSRYGTEPWGTVTGVMLGAIGGLYLLIKEAIKANR